MPDFDDTTGCAPTQEPAPPADNRFANETLKDLTRLACVVIDACASIVDARRAELNRDRYIGTATCELLWVAVQIRALKKHL